MIHHYITQYKENGKHYAEAWLQINFLRWCFCFARRKIEIHEIKESC